MARVPPAAAIAPRRLRRLIRGEVFLSGRASLRTTTASVVPVRHMIPTSSNRSWTPTLRSGRGVAQGSGGAAATFAFRGPSERPALWA
jgi:hypothetical protein